MRYPVKTLLIALLCLLPQLAMARSIEDYYRCSHDKPLVDAIEILEKNPSTLKTANYILDNQVRLIFREMLTFHKSYKNFDALSVVTDDGQQLVYISERHRGAPPQALAALVSHEVMHADKENSVNEEVIAWTREAQTWSEMLQSYPILKTIEIKTYPLVDRLNALVILNQQSKIASQVKSNKAYQKLPEHSPGF